MENKNIMYSDNFAARIWEIAALVKVEERRIRVLFRSGRVEILEHKDREGRDEVFAEILEEMKK